MNAGQTERTEPQQLWRIAPEQLNAELVRRLPLEFLKKQHAIPIVLADGTTAVALADVLNVEAYDAIVGILGQACPRVRCPAPEIENAISQCCYHAADGERGQDDEFSKAYSPDSDGTSSVQTHAEDLLNIANKAPAIKLVNKIVFEAVHSRASDIHIEPYETEVKIRFRVDGVLHNVLSLARQQAAPLLSRLNIMANLNIAEHRLPQDGQSRVRIGEELVDIRVSVIPTAGGERVVLRLLDKGRGQFRLEDVGFAPETRRVFRDLIGISHGIILLTGPTGSGKTTTLYAGLSQINDIQRKIITIEDPIEYQLHGINQIQVSRKAGLTFASGLRSILRHDPDVVLVGEIRDVETAEIAIQASLTGHLVFSTLHTNDAPTALTRLVDMGIEPYLVASSLEAVIAQRLVRTICPECKEELPEQEVAPLRRRFGDRLPAVLYKGRGCRNCQGTGYRGRMGIFEMMVVTDDVRSLILDNASPRDLRMASAKQGMTSLRDDGFRHLHAGRTTVEEILRVTKDDMFEPMDTADTSQERQE